MNELKQKILSAEHQSHCRRLKPIINLSVEGKNIDCTIAGLVTYLSENGHALTLSKDHLNAVYRQLRCYFFKSHADVITFCRFVTFNHACLSLYRRSEFRWRIARCYEEKNTKKEFVTKFDLETLNATLKRHKIIKSKNGYKLLTYNNVVVTEAKGLSSLYDKIKDYCGSKGFYWWKKEDLFLLIFKPRK